MLTTVTGSYPKVPNRPRPARLRNALNKLDRGAISAEEVDQIRAGVTREVIAEQVDAGIDLITDGLIRWDDEVTYFARALDGVTLNGLFRYFDTNTYYRQPVIGSAVGWAGPVTVDDYRFAAENSTRPVKAILPAPYSLARLSIDEHYGGDLEGLVLDMAAAVNQEARALADAGAACIQFNEPMLTKDKGDVGLAIKGLERALDGVSAKTQVHFYYGDVDGILGALSELPTDVIGLDFVMGPANFAALQSSSLKQEICAGLVDARNTRMENEDQLVEQIRRIGDFVGDGRLQVSPNMGLEFLPRERAQQKLRLMVSAARRAEEVTV